MRKKISMTVVERAIEAVPGFDKVAQKLEQQVTLRGQCCLWAGTPTGLRRELSRTVAISNARILKVTDTQVTFRWCDRKKGYKTRTQTITGKEFLERFLDHIVPPCFRRIRHLGFLSARSKAAALEKARKSLGVDAGTLPKLSRAEILSLRFGDRSQLKCRHCGNALVMVESYPKERAPPSIMNVA